MIKVKEWIDYQKSSTYADAPCGGMGGWFGKSKDGWDAGHRWKDYIEKYKEEARPYLEAIRESVIENGIRYTGQEHEDRTDGTPLFNDETVAIFSFRGWGDLMAAIWSEKENKNYCYMDFYC